MVLGWFVAPNFLHPARRALGPGLVQQADASLGQIGARRGMGIFEHSLFLLRAGYGVTLMGFADPAASH